MKPHLLIVDDEEDIVSQMKWALSKDYQVVTAGDREGALAAVREGAPEVVLLDLGLPPRPADPDEGLEILGEIASQHPHVKVIVSTGQGEKSNALQAVNLGAYDFLTKPVNLDELRIILKRAFYLAHLERENRDLHGRLGGQVFEGMLGNSAAMQDVFASIRKVATTDVPVFILGESGTGKEMAALAIHRLGVRRDGPFVAINCGAIPETLLESELFGHEKGAFTGAHVQRKGRIEAAEGGTLFLDEIGDLPGPLQVKLLRFLQEQKIERVGGRTSVQVDTRLIAATNANIQQAMAGGKFREDLYFRLAVVVLQMPPLREREGDIPVLAKVFLKKYASEFKKEVRTFTQQALRVMESYAWPGNIREMENRVKRAVIMAEGSTIGAADLQLDERRTRRMTLREAREALDRDMIQGALVRNKGKISGAATELDISRPALYEIMEKLGVRREAGEKGGGDGDA